MAQPDKLRPVCLLLALVVLIPLSGVHAACNPSCQANFQWCNNQDACVDCSPCRNGFGVRASCTETRDTQCTECTGNLYSDENAVSACKQCSRCPAGQGVTTACTSTSNTQCDPCTGSKYSDTNDYTACKDCRTACNPGQELVGSCTSSTNPTCANCVEGETYSTDGVRCLTCTTTCQVGQGLQSECTTTANGACETCTDGKYSDVNDGSACKDCRTSCGVGSELLGDCTSETTPTCAECGEEKYKDWSGPQSCRDCTQTCPPGEELKGQCTPSTNRQCTACDNGKYKDWTGFTPCANCDTCESNTEWQESDCTATSDRVCRPVSTDCDNSNQYIKRGATATSDIVCDTCTSRCNRGRELTGICDGRQTKDRTCEWCQPGKFQPRNNTPNKCQNCRQCTDGTNYETAPCTRSSNRQCSACKTCTGGLSDVGGCTGTTNRICEDITDPVITLRATQITIEAALSFSAACPVSVIDEVDGAYLCSNVDIDDGVDPDKPGTYDVVYSATDKAGNTATKTFKVTVIDTTPPNFQLVGASTVDHEAGTPFNDPGATAFDIVDKNMNNRISSNANTQVKINVVGDYVVTYTLPADSSGNQAEALTRVVKVRDTDAPTITILGDNPLYHEGATTYDDPGATASDVLDGDISDLIQATGEVNTMAAAGSRFDIEYRVTDTAGLITTETRTVIIKDETDPVISLTGQALIVHEAATTYNDPGATASDTLDGDITDLIEKSSNVNVRNPVTPVDFKVSYTVTDKAGNRGTAERTVRIVDTTKPVLSLIDPDMTVVLEAAIDAAADIPGATAVDSLDGVIPAQNIIKDTSEVDFTPDETPVTFTVYYRTQDRAANPSEITRSVTVVDTTPPTLELSRATTNVATNSDTFNWAFLIGTASDLLDGDIKSRVETTSELTKEVQFPLPICQHSSAHVDLDIPPQAHQPLIIEPGLDTRLPHDTEYRVTYSLADKAGNPAEATLLVTLRDGDDPELTLSGDTEIILEYDPNPSGPGLDVFDEEGFSVLDESSGDITAYTCITVTEYSPITPGVTSIDAFELTDRSESDTGTYNLIRANSVVGTLFKITYRVEDSAGHLAEAERRVLLVDTTPPELILSGEMAMSVPYGTVYREPGFSAIDLYNGDVTDTVGIYAQTDIDVFQPGDYLIVYNVTDANGNTAEQTRTVTIDAFASPSEGFTLVFELKEPLPSSQEQLDARQDQLQRQLGDLFSGFAFILDMYDPVVRKEELKASSSQRRSRRSEGTSTVVEAGVRKNSDLTWMTAEEMLSILGKKPTDTLELVLNAEVSKAYSKSEGPPSSTDNSIIGIAVGVVVAVIVLVVVAVLLVRRRQQHGLDGKTKRPSSVNGGDPNVMYNNPVYENDQTMVDTQASIYASGQDFAINSGKPAFEEDMALNGVNITEIDAASLYSQPSKKNKKKNGQGSFIRPEDGIDVSNLYAVSSKGSAKRGKRAAVQPDDIYKTPSNLAAGSGNGARPVSSFMTDDTYDAPKGPDEINGGHRAPSISFAAPDDTYDSPKGPESGGAATGSGTLSGHIYSDTYDAPKAPDAATTASGVNGGLAPPQNVYSEAYDTPKSGSAPGSNLASAPGSVGGSRENVYYSTPQDGYEAPPDSTGQVDQEYHVPAGPDGKPRIEIGGEMYETLDSNGASSSHHHQQQLYEPAGAGKAAPSNGGQQLYEVTPGQAADDGAVGTIEFVRGSASTGRSDSVVHRQDGGVSEIYDSGPVPGGGTAMESSHSPSRLTLQDEAASRPEYHGKISRAVAEERLLSSKTPGRFLIRLSGAVQGVVISCLGCASLPEHHKVQRDNNTGLITFNDEALSVPVRTLSQLLKHLAVNIDHTSALLSEPVRDSSHGDFGFDSSAPSSARTPQSGSSRRPTAQQPPSQLRSSQQAAPQSGSSRRPTQEKPPAQKKPSLRQKTLDNSGVSSAPLEQQPWFHGKINRVAAEQRLTDFVKAKGGDISAFDGLFLVRARDDNNTSYALSMVASGAISHHLVEVYSKGCHVNRSQVNPVCMTVGEVVSLLTNTEPTACSAADVPCKLQTPCPVEDAEA